MLIKLNIINKILFVSVLIDALTEYDVWNRVDLQNNELEVCKTKLILEIWTRGS